MSGSELVRQLNELAELHHSGAITASEFTAAKALLLGQQPAAMASPLRPDLAGAVGSDLHGYGPAQPDSSPAGQPPSAHSTTSPTPSLAPLASPPNAGTSAEAPSPPYHDNLTQRSPARPISPQVSAIVALAGGLLALLAFFAMPLVSAPFLGSLTGAGLAGFASQEGSLALLWLVPLAAAGVVGIGAWQQFAPMIPSSSRRTGSIVVIVLSGATVITYIIALAIVQAQIDRSGASQFGLNAGDLTGAGFWVALLGMLTAGIAALADVTGFNPAASPRWRGPTGNPPPWAR